MVQMKAVSTHGLPLAENLYTQIQMDIIKGVLPAGKKLTEQSLCEQYKVSRTPVREALRQLEIEGLVENIPNRGSFVVGFTSQDIKDIYELRKTYEIQAVKWAIDRINEDELDELGKIAAYIHDIGNCVNRNDHAQSGAVMAFQILNKMGFSAEEIADIVGAIGNHDEGTGSPVSPITAALILADKSDVRRTRVRFKSRTAEKISADIHDRVNYAVEHSEIIIIPELKKAVLSLQIDTSISPVMEYFEIFLSRMVLCRNAAEFLGLTFELNINSIK